MGTIAEERGTEKNIRIKIIYTLADQPMSARDLVDEVILYINNYHPHFKEIREIEKKYGEKVQKEIRRLMEDGTIYLWENLHLYLREK